MVTYEFRKLFNEAVAVAIAYVEENAVDVLSQNVVCELHGCGYSGTILNFEKTLSTIFINESEYYFVIDVAVIETSNTYTKVFVRVSGHPTTSFDKTYNYGRGSGPFKQLISGKINRVN